MREPARLGLASRLAGRRARYTQGSSRPELPKPSVTLCLCIVLSTAVEAAVRVWIGDGDWNSPSSAALHNLKLLSRSRELCPMSAPWTALAVKIVKLNAHARDRAGMTR